MDDSRLKRLIERREGIEPENRKLRVTLGQLVDAIQGFFWQDMVSELAEIRQNAMERLSEERELEEVYKFQGRIEALNMCLNLPSVMLEELEQEQEDAIEEKDTKTT